MCNSIALTQKHSERRKWSRHLYGIDTRDPDLYDLVLHIGTMTVDDAVSTLQRALEIPRFRTTSESRGILDQLSSAAQKEAEQA